MDERLANLEVRLSCAEQRLRTSRWAAAGLVIVTLTLLIAKPGVTLVEDSKVEAPFRVVDSRGNELLRVDSDESGARLVVMNRKGRPALILRETGMAVYNNDGMVTGGLYNAQDGGALVVADKTGKRVLQLTGMANGGSITVFSICRTQPDSAARSWGCRRTVSPQSIFTGRREVDTCWSMYRMMMGPNSRSPIRRGSRS